MNENRNILVEIFETSDFKILKNVTIGMSENKFLIFVMDIVSEIAIPNENGYKILKVICSKDNEILHLLKHKYNIDLKLNEKYIQDNGYTFDIDDIAPIIYKIYCFIFNKFATKNLWFDVDEIEFPLDNMVLVKNDLCYYFVKRTKHGLKFVSDNEASCQMIVGVEFKQWQPI